MDDAEMGRRIRAFSLAKARLVAAGGTCLGEFDTRIDADALERAAESILAEWDRRGEPGGERDERDERGEDMGISGTNGHANGEAIPPRARGHCERHGDYESRTRWCPKCQGERIRDALAAKRAAKAAVPEAEGVRNPEWDAMPDPPPPVVRAKPAAAAVAIAPAPVGLDALAAELAAAQAVAAALGPLDDAARRRVIGWVAGALGTAATEDA